ncbi:MAG TPA: S8 family peptidase [Thermoanaerobaculia bacterium]|jgi:serine protease|nr:S8 family peptidase [Thermoanaerobaculia bacterium]
MSTRKRKSEQSSFVKIVLKFRERLSNSERLGTLLQNVVERAGIAAGDMRLRPLVESLAPRELDALIDRARRLDSEYKPVDFSVWFQADVPTSADPDELVRVIRGSKEIETAYIMRPGPPPVNPDDDPRSANQGYLDAAPNGIDARYAWGFTGGDGTGIGFVDVEQGWNLNHDDLAAAGITIISGVSTAYPDHGTSVLGEVLMVDNTQGGVGIAPSARGRVVSQWRTAGYNTPDAILDAAAHMSFGDVLLLEAQEHDPVGGLYYWPVEIVDATYEAIRLTTALGIVVVEAGCNGGYDLDAYMNISGKKIFDRSSPDFRESGAIMIGAGSSTAPHSRLSFSNYGSRIDCYAWGENIDTTTTNSAGTDNTLYTTTFGGTSGASPMIVGAALIIQGLAQSSLGYRFSPRELRRILLVGATPSAAPATDKIGAMPNLNAIISGNELNLAADLYLRDYVGDDGNPTSGTVSISPDIIVRQAAVPNPQASFGPGSGTENDPNLSDDVRAAHNNFVYVRVLNRGGTEANNVSVDVYWSPPSTLVSPNLWNLVGSANLPSVPIGNALTVSDGITWPGANVPAAGHYCFVAIAGNLQDPKPDPATFSTFDQYVTYVENNNNVAWRNFNVVVGPPSGGPPGFHKLSFLVAGAFDTSHSFQLEASGHLPAKSSAFLEVPMWLADALRPHPNEVKVDGKRSVARMPLHPQGILRLGQAVLHARSKAECALFVKIPENSRANHYDFAIRQLYNQKEVGRVTWRFAAARKTKKK